MNPSRRKVLAVRNDTPYDVAGKPRSPIRLRCPPLPWPYEESADIILDSAPPPRRIDPAPRLRREVVAPGESRRQPRLLPLPRYPIPTPRELMYGLLTLAIVATMFLALVSLLGCERVVEPTFEDDPVTWDPSRFPLSVTYEADFDPDDVRAGADFWNRGACPLFDVSGAGDGGDIVIEVGDDVAQDSYGGWGIRSCPAGMCGIVYVRQSLFETGPAIIIAHELGHLLGLAHDTTQNRSIMHPQAASQIGYLNVTDKDRAALGEMYCE